MKNKTYDKAFKEHAVNLWLGSGKSAQEVADELGIKRDRLYWSRTMLQRLAAEVPVLSNCSGKSSGCNWRTSDCASSGTI